MLLRRHHREATDSTDTDDNGPTDTAPPARSASKTDWLTFALASGADQAEAEALTRDQLAEQYGR